MAQTSVRDDDLARKYWNVNVPRHQWTRECPAFLASVDKWDEAQLCVRDEDYDLMSWKEVKSLISELLCCNAKLARHILMRSKDTNRLESFKRVPSDLRRYRKYIADLKQTYGSVMEFIMRERVRWSDLTPRGEPFENAEDIRILFNDWPYGIDRDIVHLVVWTKFSFEEDLDTGDLTPDARKLIDDFVERKFRSCKGSGEVAWFKNWALLKSVHAVEHFHVMLYRPDPDFIRQTTNGDVAMATKLEGR